MDLTTTILLDGLTFPECPRWHEGALWFSDVHAHTIIRMTPDGRAQRVIENAHQPAGLGWLPNGDLLYVRMVDRTLVRVAQPPFEESPGRPPAESSDTGDVAQPSVEESPGRPAVQSSDKTVPDSEAKDGSPPPVEASPARPPANGHDTMIADLTHLEPVQLNDMTVDHSGRAYIGGFGFDINKGDPFATSSIYLLDLRDGARAPSPANSADTTSAPTTPQIAAGNMRFPNGMVVTPDGRTLIAAETVGRSLTAFDIDARGALTNRREWAALPVFPDGICLDAENAVWVASPTTGECLRVREGGEITDKVKAHARGVYACMLGGESGRTLYLCTANTTGPELAQGISTGWIEQVEVEVPHAGLP